MPAKPKLFTSTLTDRTWHLAYGMDDVTGMRDVGHVNHGSASCEPNDLDITIPGARGKTIKTILKCKPVSKENSPTKWMPCLLVATMLLVTLSLLVSAAIVVSIRQDANDITQLRTDITRLIKTQNASDSQGQDILVTLNRMALTFTEVKENIITPECIDTTTASKIDTIILNMDAFFTKANAILEEIDEKQRTLIETTNHLNNSIEQVDVVLNGMVNSVKESIKEDLKPLNSSFKEMANNVNTMHLTINSLNDSLNENSQAHLKSAGMLGQINASVANVSLSQLKTAGLLVQINASVTNVSLSQLKTAGMLGQINASVANVSLSQLKTANMLETINETVSVVSQAQLHTIDMLGHINISMNDVSLAQHMLTGVLVNINATVQEVSLTQLDSVDLVGNINTTVANAYIAQLKAVNVLENINTSVAGVSLSQVNTVYALGNINASVADVSQSQLMAASVLVNINTTVQDVLLQQSTTHALVNMAQISVNDVLITVGDIMTLTNKTDCSEGRFKVVRTPRLSWDDAKLSCQAMGGFLAEMTDFFALDYIRREVYPEETQDNGLSINLWVGATDVSREGVWLWDRSREPISVQNWEVGGPHAVTPAMDCMEMVQEGEWNDEECTRQNGYICERLTGDCEVWQ